MAFLPGIFNRTPAPAPAPVAPAPQVNANGSAGPAGAQQAGPANPAAHPGNMGNGAPVNPMDAYAAMFTPKAVDPAAPRKLGINDPYLGALDPVAFKQQVSTANFAANIAPDQLQKAMSGDAAAFMDVLNHVGRESFSAATQLSHGLVEQGVRTGAERVNSGMDSHFRNLQLKSQNTSNAALNHPAVAPMLNAVKTQIATSNPNLSAAEVQQQAESYFTEMADVLVAPKNAAATAKAMPASQDFSSYL